MTKRDLVSVALKVYAVMLLAQTIGYIPTNVEIFLSISSGQVQADNRVMMWMSVAGPAAWLILGVALLWSADSIARLIVREDSVVPTVDIERNGRGLLTLALKTSGVILAAIALPQLVEQLAQFQIIAAREGFTVTESLSRDYLRDVKIQQWTSFARALTGVAVGVYLVAGTRGLVKLIYREAQSGGAQPSPDP